MHQSKRPIRIQRISGHGVVKELNGYDGVISFNNGDLIYISNDSTIDRDVQVGDRVTFDIKNIRSPKHPTLTYADNIQKLYLKRGKIMKRKSNPKKAAFSWDSKKVIDDLAKFFKEKFEDKSLKEIKEEIKESLSDSSGRYSSEGGASVTVDGEEFNLIENSDEFEDIAIQYVKDMLDNEPESFTESFISNHIYISNTDKSMIASEEADAYYDDMKDREIEKEYERKNGEILGDEDDPDYDSMREELKSDYSDNIEKELDDPIDYFVNQQGIYSLEDLLKSSFIRIDTDEAAKDAVNEDGAAHFLSHYDGNYEETGLGIIVMKE